MNHDEKIKRSIVQCTSAYIDNDFTSIHLTHYELTLLDDEIIHRVHPLINSVNSVETILGVVLSAITDINELHQHGMPPNEINELSDFIVEYLREYKLAG